MTLQKTPAGPDGPGAGPEPAAAPEQLRERATRLVKKRHDFAAHLLVYAMVNGFLIVIWAITGSGFFWPVFPLAGWGIGVVMNAWDVWHGEISEAAVQREMRRLQRRG